MSIRQIDGKTVLSYFNASNGNMEVRVADDPTALGAAPVTTVVFASEWPDPAEDLPPPEVNRLAQPYGGYISPGSTLDEVRVFISQWNTAAARPVAVPRHPVRGEPSQAVVRAEGRFARTHSQLIHMQFKTAASLTFACSDDMSETTSTPEPATAPVATTTPPPQTAYVEREPRRSRLNAVAAWVGIVAGVVFIVAVIFFSGFVLGAHSGGHRGSPRRRRSRLRDVASRRTAADVPDGPDGTDGAAAVRTPALRPRWTRWTRLRVAGAAAVARATSCTGPAV